MGKGHSLQLLTQQMEPWSRDQVETVFSPIAWMYEISCGFFWGGSWALNPHTKMAKRHVWFINVYNCNRSITEQIELKRLIDYHTRNKRGASYTLHRSRCLFWGSRCSWCQGSQHSAMLLYLFWWGGQSIDDGKSTIIYQDLPGLWDCFYLTLSTHSVIFKCCYWLTKIYLPWVSICKSI